MKKVCDYCGGYISETDEVCPNCGAVNEQYKRVGEGVPQTIEELKAWYTAHNLPPEEVTRFFIGKDYKEPKAFGIYQDGERFIVYKNKADGSRAIRYEGGDEAYAVNELYLKLKEEIARQKAQNQAKSSGNTRKKKKDWLVDKLLSGLVTLGIIMMITAAICVIAYIFDNDGYYYYNNAYYYNLDNTWYLYDTSTSDWESVEVDRELDKNAKDYYESSSYSEEYGVSDFEDTTYYSDWKASQDDDWDSDSNWDSGDDWDSGSGDWDSDW